MTALWFTGRQRSRGDRAAAFTFDDGIGEIGIIAPVSRAFCGALQPRSAHFGRQDPHLPLFTDGPRPIRRD